MSLNSDQQLHADVMLTLVPGVGPRIRAQLLNEFGESVNVLRQNRESLASVAGVGAGIADGILAADRARAFRLIERCREMGVRLVQRNDQEFPASLETLPDAPGLLYVRGSLEPQDSLAVAIVGSRRCTAYGRRMAERLAASLVRAGFTIVSGLARGIDAAAHHAALNAGGRTIAVLATGVEDIYPPEHAELALEITDSGCLVSEFPLDQRTSPGLFPQRNRIISGLSLGVIVVEATRNSGALYTARHAMEQGRDVFAVPGQADSLSSAGCHDLIREGGVLVRNVDDVLDDLGPLATPTVSAERQKVHHPRELTLNPQEKEILDLIETTPVSVDVILRATQLDESRVLSTLTVLEVRRFIRRLPGSMLIRNS